jgi:hypothetical protein
VIPSDSARDRYAQLWRDATKKLLPLATKAASDARYFFPLLAVMQLFVTRKVFGPGLLADIDSVCHVAYLRYLVEEFFPNTGTFFGYTPKFNGGAPFLLYNVPPGTYLLGFALVKLGMSAGFAIKVLLSLSFYANSVWAWLLGIELSAQRHTTSKTPDPITPGGSHLPAILATSVALFSSDLFGLEFYFKNGMVNPCLALPMVGFAGVAYLRTCRVSGASRMRWLAVLALLFASILLTHILSAYFCALLLGCILVTGDHRRLGERALYMGFAVALGAALAAFWLWPSLPFAPKQDAATIWIRHPGDTLSSFLDGSLLSSYFGGFAHSYRITSNHSFIAVGCAGFGAVHAARTRNRAVLGLVLFTLVSLVLTLGPTVSLGTQFLPGYRRLLWYRFVTPLAMGTIVVGGYGVHALLRERTGGPLVRYGVAAAGLVSLFLLLGRGARLRTDQEFGTFTTSYQDVAAWLRKNGKPRARIFSEFLATGAIEPPSVNYARQMLPIDSGLSELGGWVYENSPVASYLIAQGSFWHAPSLLADQANRLNAQYIIVGTPAAVRAFEMDARWKAVLRTSDLVVFESQAKDLALATAKDREVRLLDEGYTRGGGYRYSFATSSGESPLVIRINSTAGWQASAGARQLTTKRTAEGFLEVVLPSSAEQVDLTFDVSASRSAGERVSAGAALVVALLLALSKRKRTSDAEADKPPRVIEYGGRLALGFAVASNLWFVTRSQPALAGFGVPGGMQPERSSKRVSIGTDEARQQGAAIQERGPKRFALRFQPGATLRLEPATGAERTATLTPPNGIACSLHFAQHATEVAIPSECGGTHPPDHPDFGPGLAATLEVSGTPPKTIEVSDSALVVQAEEFENSLDDSGYEALPSPGHSETIPQNGQTLVAIAPREGSIVLHKNKSFAPGRYDIWVLADSTHPRLARTRAKIELLANAKTVGSTSASDLALPSDYWRTTPSFRWTKLGTAEIGQTTSFELRFVPQQKGMGGLAEIDALEFVWVEP